jgi:hypothetical protein
VVTLVASGQVKSDLAEVELTPETQSIVFSEPTCEKAEALVMAWRFAACMRDHSQCPKAARTDATVLDSPEPMVLIRVMVLCDVCPVWPKGWTY